MDVVKEDVLEGDKEGPLSPDTLAKPISPDPVKEEGELAENNEDVTTEGR